MPQSPKQGKLPAATPNTNTNTNPSASATNKKDLHQTTGGGRGGEERIHHSDSTSSSSMSRSSSMSSSFCSSCSGSGSSGSSGGSRSGSSSSSSSSSGSDHPSTAFGREFTVYDSDGSVESDFVYDDEGHAVRTVLQRHRPYLLTHQNLQTNHHHYQNSLPGHMSHQGEKQQNKHTKKKKKTHDYDHQPKQATDRAGHHEQDSCRSVASPSTPSPQQQASPSSPAAPPEVAAGGGGGGFLGFRRANTLRDLHEAEEAAAKEQQREEQHLHGGVASSPPRTGGDGSAVAEAKASHEAPTEDRVSSHPEKNEVGNDEGEGRLNKQRHRHRHHDSNSGGGGPPLQPFLEPSYADLHATVRLMCVGPSSPTTQQHHGGAEDFPLNNTTTGNHNNNTHNNSNHFNKKNNSKQKNDGQTIRRRRPDETTNENQEAENEDEEMLAVRTATATTTTTTKATSNKKSHNNTLSNNTMTMKNNNNSFNFNATQTTSAQLGASLRFRGGIEDATEGTFRRERAPTTTSVSIPTSSANHQEEHRGSGHHHSHHHHRRHHGHGRRRANSAQVIGSAFGFGIGDETAASNEPFAEVPDSHRRHHHHHKHKQHSSKLQAIIASNSNTPSALVSPPDQQHVFDVQSLTSQQSSSHLNSDQNREVGDGNRNNNAEDRPHRRRHHHGRHHHHHPRDREESDMLHGIHLSRSGHGNGSSHVIGDGGFLFHGGGGSSHHQGGGGGDVLSRGGGVGSTASTPRSLAASTVLNASLMDMPTHLRQLGREIKRLDTLELLHVAGLVSRKAHREVYSVVQYTGSNWYLPRIRKCRPNEPNWHAHYNFQEGLVLHIAGQCLELQMLSYIFRIAFLFLLYFMLWTILPEGLMGRGGVVFDPVVTVVFATMVGGFVCRLLQIPPLVGILWAAILWNNVGPYVGYFTGGIHKEVRTIAGRLGITVLLLRAGFSTSWKSVRPILPNASALSVSAMIAEALVHSFLAEYLFEYGSYTWAFLHGFVCSVVSGAVVVPAVLLLQGDGYGKDRGPLPLMLSAVGVETVLGVWICNFLVGLLFSDASVGLSIGLGPVQIVGGAIIGVFLAFFFHYIVELLKTEAKRMPNGKIEPSHLENVMNFALMIFLALAFSAVFLGYRFQLAGGGCVIAMVFALVTAHLWLKDNDPELMEQKRMLGHGLCSSWDIAIMPFLFSMTGSKIKLGKIFNSTFFPKAIACFAASNVTRVLVTNLTSIGLEFNPKERVLHSLGWMAKATVQSAMSGVALENALRLLADGDAVLRPAEYAGLLRDQERATIVQNMAVFYVMFGAPIAAIALTKWGPHVLQKELMVH